MTSIRQQVNNSFWQRWRGGGYTCHMVSIFIALENVGLLNSSTGASSRNTEECSWTGQKKYIYRTKNSCFLHSFIHSFIHSSLRPFLRSFKHSFIRSSFVSSQALLFSSFQFLLDFRFMSTVHTTCKYSTVWSNTYNVNSKDSQTFPGPLCFQWFQYCVSIDVLITVFLCFSVAGCLVNSSGFSRHLCCSL